MYVTKFHDTLNNENLLSNSRPSPLHCLQVLPVILESSPYRIYLFRISSATMFPRSLWPQSRALPPVGPMPCDVVIMCGVTVPRSFVQLFCVPHSHPVGLLPSGFRDDRCGRRLNSSLFSSCTLERGQMRQDIPL